MSPPSGGGLSWVSVERLSWLAGIAAALAGLVGLSHAASDDDRDPPDPPPPSTASTADRPTTSGQPPTSPDPAASDATEPSAVIWDGEATILNGGSLDLDTADGSGAPDILMPAYFEDWVLSFSSDAVLEGGQPSLGFVVPTADLRTCRSVSPYSFTTRDIVLVGGEQICVLTTDNHLAGVRIDDIAPDVVTVSVTTWRAEL